MKIKAKRCVLGRPIAKEATPIKSPKTFDVGYGPGQLRPDGSRDLRAEERILAKLTMDANGLSGQLAS